jgi:hypothetical protein
MSTIRPLDINPPRLLKTNLGTLQTPKVDRKSGILEAVKLPTLEGYPVFMRLAKPPIFKLFLAAGLPNLRK